MSDIVYDHVINNDPYWFKVDLYNADGKVQSIAPAGIKALVIEDNLYNFYHKGYIVIDNRFDAIERSVFENVQSPDQGPSFIFMGDARDWIQIEITPRGANDELLTKRSIRHTKIFIQGAIYAIEDIASDTPDVKVKKLYFWDKYYQYLREKNLYWSTSDVLENMLIEKKDDSLSILKDSLPFRKQMSKLERLKVKNVMNFTDRERAIPTGQAIKNLLAKALPKEDKYPAHFPAADFGKSNNITESPVILKNDRYWDLGCSSIFFSSPAQYKAIDGLAYLLERHVSNIESLYDMAILRIDRASRCFTFRPLNSYFKDSYVSESDSGGSGYLETVILGGFDNGGPGQKMRFASVADFTPKNNRFKMFQTGSVTNFSFEPSVGELTQSGIASYIIHSYNYKDKEFYIDNKYNNIEEIIKTYHKNYVATIKADRWASIVPGIYRTKNKNTITKFSNIEYDEIQRISQGRNKALYTAIFANNQIRFRVNGSTIRQAGKFIGVDRDGSSPMNEYDQKFLGIYIITEVNHIFEGNDYYNEITAIKTYTDLQIYKGQIGPDNQNINNQVTV